MSYPRRKPRSYELLGETHEAVYGEDRTKRLAELADVAQRYRPMGRSHLSAVTAGRHDSEARSEGEARSTAAAGCFISCGQLPPSSPRQSKLGTVHVAN